MTTRVAMPKQPTSHTIANTLNAVYNVFRIRRRQLPPRDMPLTASRPIHTAYTDAEPTEGVCPSIKPAHRAAKARRADRNVDGNLRKNLFA